MNMDYGTWQFGSICPNFKVADDFNLFYLA